MVDAHEVLWLQRSIANRVVAQLPESEEERTSTPTGQRTLAHELTHVVQQRSGPVDGSPAPGGLRLSDPSDRFERQAEQVMTRRAIDADYHELGADAGVGVALQRRTSTSSASFRPIRQRKRKAPAPNSGMILDLQRRVGNRAVTSLVPNVGATLARPVHETTPVIVQRKKAPQVLDAHPRLKQGAGALAEHLPEGSVTAADIGVDATDQLDTTVNASMQSVNNVGPTVLDPTSPDFSQAASSAPDAATGLLGAAGGTMSTVGNLAITVLYGKGFYGNYKKYKKARKTAITKMKDAPDEEEEARQAAKLAQAAKELADELDAESIKCRVLAKEWWDKPERPGGFRANRNSQLAEIRVKQAERLEGQAKAHMEKAKQYKIEEEQHKANAEAARKLAAEEAASRGEHRSAAFVNAQGAAAGTMKTAASFASTVGHSAQGALQIAALAGTASSGALTTAGTLAGGATAVVVGPMAAAMAAYNTYKQTTAALEAGDKKRNAFNFQSAKGKWEKLKESLANQIPKLGNLKARRVLALNQLACAQPVNPKRIRKLEKRRGKLEDEIIWLNARMSYKREELRLVMSDLAVLEQIGRNPSVVDFTTDEQKQGRQRGHRAVWGKKEAQEEAPENVAQIIGFYQEKKGRAEWRAWTEAAGSSVQAAGSLASTAGGVLTIAGAAGMGAGAVPGLVICAVGGATSLTGTAISSVSYGNKLTHAIVKLSRGTKGLARRTMAKYLVAFAAGRKAPNDNSALSQSAWVAGSGPATPGLLESGDKEQLRAWVFMAKQALVRSLASYTKIKEAVEQGNEFSDLSKVTQIEQEVFESFSSTSA